MKKKKEEKKLENKEYSKKELKNKVGIFVWWTFWIIYLEMIYRILCSFYSCYDCFNNYI